MAQEAIMVRGVHKSFGALKVLRGVSLAVREGEVVTVIGPSGSGKSTLARCIARLEKIDGGEIEVCGRRLDQSMGNAQQSELMGMIFQQFNLFPHLTVMENLMLAQKKVRGRDEATAKAKALELLDRVGLADKALAHPGQLSGGQQQRVAIARALCMEPRIMLFDEPTSALDPELVGDVLDVIASLTRTGMTMLIITHEMTFAHEVSDRVVFMADGQVVEQGSPRQVLEHPERPRTQMFLKRMLAHHGQALEDERHDA